MLCFEFEIDREKRSNTNKLMKKFGKIKVTGFSSVAGEKITRGKKKYMHDSCFHPCTLSLF